MENELIPVDSEEEIRLDVFVSVNCEITRSSAAKLIEDSLVLVNQKTCTKKSFNVKRNDTVSVQLPDPIPCKAEPQDIAISIVYEDSDVIVVNKPQGMVVHPAPGNPDGTLVNALLFHCKEGLSGINGVIRPGIVHRIDKDTSGLLMVAKNDKAHLALAEQIKEHSFKRIYYAVLIGCPKELTGTVNAPIGRNAMHRKKMAVTDKNAREATTHYRIIEQFNGYSLVELKLETGRTHQIRVHMAYIGHPIVGDPLYAPNAGKNQFSLQGQCLHAKTLGFVHPSSGSYMEFDSDLPNYFEKTLTILRNKL
jgi:pseudouridine synthase, RluA family